MTAPSAQSVTLLSRKWGLSRDLTGLIREFMEWGPTPSARAFKEAFAYKDIWTGQRICVYYGPATRWTNLHVAAWKALFPWEDVENRLRGLMWMIDVQHAAGLA